MTTKTMLISEFKAKCIAVLKEVERSGEAVVVTLRGRPMARVEPLAAGTHCKQLGTLKGSMRIRRDTSASSCAGSCGWIRLQSCNWPV